MTPFHALYGYIPPHLAFPTEITTFVAAVEKYLKQRDNMLGILKESLSKARERMKWFADKKRIDISLSVGDWVYLKLQPYRKSSVSLQRDFKLAARYYDRYMILERIGQVAYKLDLPAGSIIDNVFHVSQLKKKLGETHVTIPTLPPVDDSGEIVLLPGVVFDSREITRRGHIVPQLLDQWSHSSPEDATWEDNAHVRAHFPKFHP
ncbi:uncharacterized protein LOC113312201 [Papaver somniferum]|uniref:uncharacterized protein LOC113312201 n=1 Tax=Papaver somniferum TaxID=3469 RepID=UPI000E70039F|nr:uncharacterized protein LOC113312201 [Papaver somniferum]